MGVKHTVQKEQTTFRVAQATKRVALEISPIS